MPLPFVTLDVFTDRRFAGNPLAVVFGGEGLDTAQMQAIAGEFNLSETVFVMPPEREVHAARIRIFTPRNELPFAGHPTVGTAIAIAQKRAADAGADLSPSLIVMEAKIGLLRVGVRGGVGAAPFAEFDLPKLPDVEAGGDGALDHEAIATALGLISSDLGCQNHTPVRADAGVPYTFVPVQSVETLAKINLNLKAWSEAFGGDGHNAAFVYAKAAHPGGPDIQARMFAPDLGVTEDPATGSAVAGLSGVIRHFDRPRPGTHNYEIAQGIEMGRPSRIALSLEVADGGGLANVRIGGQAVAVASGVLAI
ncbi:MAG: PhzF family phenazine biosynthesis protein [Pseudomonadota bacterium]